MLVSNVGLLLSMLTLMRSVVGFHHPYHVVKVGKNHPLEASPKKDVEQNQGDKLVYDQQQNRFYESSRGDDSSGEQGDEFCLVDPDTGKYILLTKEEKERIFLDAIQSHYYSGKSTLTNEQFDQLRSDLTWEGSALVTLNRNETLFVNAVAAYEKGTPIMSDRDFEALKRSLRESGSRIAVATQPKTYMDTGVCKVTWLRDSLRTSSLYLPAALIFTVLYLGIVYELPYMRGAFNPLVLLGLGAYPIYRAAVKVTENFFFKDPLVAKGPCPSCGAENRIFFGGVLGVQGDESESTLRCCNCKKQLTVKRDSLRVSTLSGETVRVPPARKGAAGTSFA